MQHPPGTYRLHSGRGDLCYPHSSFEKWKVTLHEHKLISKLTANSKQHGMMSIYRRPEIGGLVYKERWTGYPFSWAAPPSRLEYGRVEWTIEQSSAERKRHILQLTYTPKQSPKTIVRDTHPNGDVVQKRVIERNLGIDKARWIELYSMWLGSRWKTCVREY